MIGIYKITNELNNKSYIGQSIHCGKRLDEHCKGNQFIDEIIQLEGVKNFTFKILKEVNVKELSYWEDYYIDKYNTIFPNGYNKRWNLSQKERQNFIENINQIDASQSSSSDTIHFPTDEDFLSTIKNSDNIYAWLLLNSFYDSINNFYYTYKENINYTTIATQMKRSRQTISTRFKQLLKNNFIQEFIYNGKKCYKILNYKDFEELDKETVFQLLYLSVDKQKEELIKTYAYLLKKKRIAIREKQKTFYCSSKEVIEAFGGSATHKEIYDRMRCIFTILQDAGIIKFKTVMAQQLANGTWCGPKIEVYEVNKRASEEWLGAENKDKEQIDQKEK